MMPAKAHSCAILGALRASPPPCPPPQGGRGDAALIRRCTRRGAPLSSPSFAFGHPVLALRDEMLMEDRPHPERSRRIRGRDWFDGASIEGGRNAQDQ